MGAVNNEAVIATTWDFVSMEKVKRWVDFLDETHAALFAFVPAITNGVLTVILAPDGSQKGWPLSSEAENLRDRFIDFLKTFDYEDGSNPFSFIEVGFGEFGQKVLRGNNENMYSDRDYHGDQPPPSQVPNSPNLVEELAGAGLQVSEWDGCG